MSNTYGLGIPEGLYNPMRSVVESPTTSPAGNLVLRVGREHEDTDTLARSWQQTEHVVLLPDEGVAFAKEILAQLGVSVTIPNDKTTVGGMFCIERKAADVTEHLTYREFVDLINDDDRAASIALALLTGNQPFTYANGTEVEQFDALDRQALSKQLADRAKEQGRQ